MKQQVKYISILFLALVMLVLFSCNEKKEDKESPNYIFFLHNKFLESHPFEAEHPQYGKAEYKAIIDSFEKDGFVVISEKRPANTDPKQYAHFTADKVDSLLKLGVPADHITIVGTSKGGYIAQYVSSFMANPDLNFVFIGCFMESDMIEFPEIQFCGNILTIYEASDEYGVSAIQRKAVTIHKINRFAEIELNTQLKHGFLYKAMNEWLEPTKMWAKRNYDFTTKN